MISPQISSPAMQEAILPASPRPSLVIENSFDPGRAGAAQGTPEVAPPEAQELDSSRDPLQERDKESIEKMVERLNREAEDLGHRLAFGLYEGTEEYYAKVIDRRTNKTLKMLPPESLLELHRKLQEALGVLVDEQA